MLQIHHAEEDTEARSPSKQYADACWESDPRISPDWWREALGHTVGKLALDWRTAVKQPEHLLTGCNLVLSSPRTLAAVNAALGSTPQPHAYVNVLITSNPAALAAPWPHLLVWQPSDPTPEQRLHTLIHLENMVKSGQIEAYGIVPDAHPLHLWLEDAANAAHSVYARRKRPGLRLLVAPLDLLDLSLLTHENTEHKSEPVSPLEFAARLGLAVIALAPSIPTEIDISRAIQSLTSAAEAEHTLNQSLGGWPQIQGRQLFNLLSHLGQGHTPWPTSHQWHNWHSHLWPELKTYWHQLPCNPAIATYLAALENLLPHGPALALSSAQPLLEEALQTLSPRFPQSWQAQTPAVRNLGMLASIPGVTAVASVGIFDPKPLQHLPNLPDVGALLLV